MFEEIADKLEELIPKKLNEFPKLTGGEPYRFKKWGFDRSQRWCLYYVVTGGKREYTKRIPLKELEAAAKKFSDTGEFNRDDFHKLCPIASRDGPCAFAVIGRILEVLYGAKYEEWTGTFRSAEE